MAIGDPKYWIPTPELEALLSKALTGLSLDGLPNRTRSKVLKQHVCVALGYPTPRSFKKTQPRFPGQYFDTYVQKSNNLQVWNEELAPSRRYVIIRVTDRGVISRIKVVTGDTLALLDRTGTLTSKYQAQCIASDQSLELVTPQDTARVAPLVNRNVDLSAIASPVQHPQAGQLLPIAGIFAKLSHLLGNRFVDDGADQERNRGGMLHRLVCTALGYTSYKDDGQFPDVRHQILEVKLQTAPTIDLGLVLPDSVEALDVPMIQGHQLRHCDVRYAIFYATIEQGFVEITNIILTTGEGFFVRFRQFKGKVLNRKLQVPLPPRFFD